MTDLVLPLALDAILDGVAETCTDTGTGALDLDGALGSRQTLADHLGLSAGETGQLKYIIVHLDADRDITDHEIGLGEVTAGSPDSLARDFVLDSADEGGLVHFRSGEKLVGVFEQTSLITDLGGQDLTDGSVVIWDTSAQEIPVARLSENVLELSAITVTSNTTTSGEGQIYVDTSGGTVTLTLASADAVAGQVIMVKDIAGTSATSAITIDTEGSETIDENASITLDTAFESVILGSDGTNWFVLARYDGTTL